MEDDEEQDDDDDNWGPITDEDARFFEDTSSNDQEDESKTYSDEPEYDDNELDDDLKGLIWKMTTNSMMRMMTIAKAIQNF